MMAFPPKKKRCYQKNEVYLKDLWHILFYFFRHIYAIQCLQFEAEIIGTTGAGHNVLNFQGIMYVYIRWHSLTSHMNTQMALHQEQYAKE